jgi:hypothetical protein
MKIQPAPVPSEHALREIAFRSSSPWLHASLYHEHVYDARRWRREFGPDVYNSALTCARAHLIGYALKQIKRIPTLAELANA